MMWDMHDGMGWWMVFAGIWMLLFWAIIIGGIAWTVVRATGGPKQESATEIARRRYARGEISREEFQRLTKDLEG